MLVNGVGGEQFAAGDTVRQLRRLRNEDDSGNVITLSAADPLNLIGIVTPGPRVPSTAANQVVYRKGRAVARIPSGEIKLCDDVTGPERQLVLQSLTGSQSDVDAAPNEESPAAKENAADSYVPRRRRRKSAKQPNYPGGIPRPLY